MVCKANAFESLCNALDFDSVAGQWLPSTMGWYEYTPPIPWDSSDGGGGRGGGSAFGGMFGASGGAFEEEQQRAFEPYIGGGEWLRQGATVTSRDGSHFLIMLWDGNLAVFEGSGPQNAGPKPIWQSR